MVDLPELMTVSQLAVLLKLSVKTIHNKVYSRQITAADGLIRVNARVIRFERATVMGRLRAGAFGKGANGNPG